MRTTETKGIAKAIKWIFVFLLYFAIGAVLGVLLFLSYFLISPREVKVPDVKGMDLGTATRVIEKAGLKVAQVHGSGTVDHTYPYAGETVKKGREINLFLSDPPEVVLPDLFGVPKETAQQILEAMGFKVRIAQMPYKGTDGRVIGMYPAAGSKLKQGSEISLLVDSGEP